MSPRHSTIRAGVAAVLTIAWALVMRPVTASYPFPHIFHHDVDSPVLALELAQDASDIDAVLHRSDPDHANEAVRDMGMVNVLDLVFIPLYALFLWSVARVFTVRTRLLTLVILAAALFDYVEDWQIYRALQGESPPIYLPSLVKWGLFGLALVLSGVSLFRSASPVYSLATKRLLAMAYFASGGLIVLSVALGQSVGYSLIELAVGIFSLLLVVHAIGMLGPYFAIPGISQTYVENFCEERKKAGQESLTAIKPEIAK